jgi:NDP-sugar pyrophosphorylase family protein
MNTRRAGVIAAGLGERLRGQGGPLKPLVRVAGRPLIVRVLASLAETAPSQVAVIINEESGDVRQTVDAFAWPFELQWIVETTPSSMHSFLRVIETLGQDGHAGPFLISTVDTVATPGMYRAFAAAAAAIDADVVLAINRPQPDDKPLLVTIGRPSGEEGDSDRQMVTAIGDAAREASGGELFATAGFYMVRPSVLAEAKAARADGLAALRLFLQRLLARGYRMAAIEVADSIDVDRPEDVIAAESFLRSARL